MRNPAFHFLNAFRFAADMNKGTPFADFGLDAMRIVAWLNDAPLIPAGLFRDYIGKLYHQYRLVNKELRISLPAADRKPETVDLAKITMPLINIVGDMDDICTPPSSVPINDIAASDDKKPLRFLDGHIELSASSAAHRELWPQVVRWLEQIVIVITF